MGFINVAIVVGEVDINKVQKFDLELCQISQDIVVIPFFYKHLAYWGKKVEENVLKEHESLLTLYFLREVVTSGLFALLWSDGHGGAKYQSAVVYDGQKKLMEDNLGINGSGSFSNGPNEKAFKILGKNSITMEYELAKIDLWEYEESQHYNYYLKYSSID